MNFDAGFIGYFLHASLIVKCVMIILASASIFSWTYILQRSFYLKGVDQSAGKFENAFWSGEDLSRLYNDTHLDQDGVQAVFQAGYKEFSRFRKQPGASLDLVVANTKRAMQAAQMRVQDQLEERLQFLAIVGSTSPYVGLFGTVWGIMTAFQALANVQQATIAMVAPGIAEALVATALGLFAAIPAVIAYNRFANHIGILINRFTAFQEEFMNILIRQSQSSQG